MAPTLRRAALVLGLVALVAVAGCAGTGDDAAPAGEATADGRSGGDADPTAGEATVAESGGGDGPRAAAVLVGVPAEERRRVRTGETTARVDDLDRAVANLTAATRRLGGFVADTERNRHRADDETWLSGRLVLRVPAGNFSALRERAAGEGTVLHAESRVEDVTGELVDLRARLENLRAQRDRLRDLYDRANETGDVLAVGKRLSGTQEDVERLERRLASLQARAALSTLTVDLREPEPGDEAAASDDLPDWAGTSAVGAFRESVGGVVTTLRLLVVAVGYLLPYGLVFGTPVVAVAAWRRRRGGTAPADAAEDAE